MRKLSKTSYGFIFTIVLLLITLGTVLYLALSGWFYSNTSNLDSDIVLGQTVNIDIKENEAQTVAFSFPGAYLPGQKIDQFINITNASDKNLYVRAKITLFDYSSGEAKLQAGVNEHWTENDGQYYFDDVLLASNKVSFASYVKLLENKYYDSTKNYIVSVVVESLDSSLDKTAIWGY